MARRTARLRTARGAVLRLVLALAVLGTLTLPSYATSLDVTAPSAPAR